MSSGGYTAPGRLLLYASQLPGYLSRSETAGGEKRPFLPFDSLHNPKGGRPPSREASKMGEPGSEASRGLCPVSAGGRCLCQVQCESISASVPGRAGGGPSGNHYAH